MSCGCQPKRSSHAPPVSRGREPAHTCYSRRGVGERCGARRYATAPTRTDAGSTVNVSGAWPWPHARRWTAALLALFMALSGCTAQRPVVADDARVRHAGQETVQQDIDECIALAKRGAPASGGAVAGETATGVAVGAGTGGAGGAAAGAVYGNAGRGAATGATAGLIRGLFAWSRTRDPQPAHANAVERCLRNRGYEPVGWE